MMNLLRGTLMLSMLFVAGAWSQTARGQAPPDATASAASRPITEAQLRTYMEESMLLQALETQIQGQVDQIRKTSMPWFPDATWQIVKDNLAAIDLVKAVLPVYQKYYTEQDGNALSLLYEGPTGHAFAVASVAAGAQASHGGLDGSDAARAAALPNYLGSARELGRKRQAELTPEQIAAVRQMQMNTAVTTLEGLRIDEGQNQVLEKTINDVLHKTMALHRKELMAARSAYNAKH
jgi:hypothetical protein